VGRSKRTAPTPASGYGRHEAQAQIHVAPEASSPPCGSPGGLLGDGAVATAEIDGGGRPRVSRRAGGAQGG
jgi:hypothetical protein